MHNWSSRTIMVNICKYHGQWWNNWTHLNTSLKLELLETNPLPGLAPDSPCSPSCLPQQMGLHIGVARDKDWDQRVYFEMPGSNDMVKHMHTPISGKTELDPTMVNAYSRVIPCPLRWHQTRPIRISKLEIMSSSETINPLLNGL